MQTVEVSKFLNIDLIDKRQVMTSDAKVVGKAYGAEVDTERWAVANILTDFDSSILSEAELSHPRVRKTRVAIPVDKVDKVSDVIQLSIDLNTLLASMED